MIKTKSGFTIVELLIVIVVIAVLAAITIVAYNGIQTRARDAERRSDIATIVKALELYNADNGSYPNASQVALQSFWLNTLNIKDETVTPPGGVTGTAYCSGQLNRYCYYGRGRSDGQAGDCTGISPQSSTIMCSGYSLKYVLETDPSTIITIAK